MKKYYFIIDVAKCWDCNNCFIVCNDEHQGNDWPGYTLAQPKHGHRWIDVKRMERGQFPLIDVAYRPTPCMHCQDAPCVKASGGTISCREDGIVLIDPVKAKGKKDLVKSCPYGAIYWNEEKDVPQKCTMCAHLLDDGWAQPRCVQACFTGALRIEKLEETELTDLILSEGLEQLHPDRKTTPNTYYKNLHLFDKVFIAGSVAVQNGDIVDCAKNVQVSLFCGQERLGQTLTDVFGDFKFDGLAPDSGSYVLKLEAEGYSPKSLQIELAESINLGTITM
jgi:Fe-S-cluster-containing dehydrogenase component